MSAIAAEVTVVLKDLDRHDLPLVGGKGANLGAMIQAGLPVPPGFCVTAATYRTFVAEVAPFISSRVADLDVDDPVALDGAAVAIRARLEAVCVPEPIASAIRDAYGELAVAMGTDDLPVAVRSSATAEDLPDASFAGQQDTMLNVRGAGALLEAVRRCWSSLWTPRAIAYRQHNGFRHEDVALAVVVQAMVDAEVSGVLFTANPIDGNRTQTVINGSWGLGEAIVSGRVSPDGWVLDAGGNILQQEIARKDIMVLPVAKGVVEQPVPMEMREQPCLLAADLRRLVELGRAAAEHFGAPQDIEWALRDGKLYLLQSRPITTLFPLPEPRPADGDFHVYLSFNAVQGVIEPFTPMGLSLFREFAALVQMATGARIVPRDGPGLLAEAAGRLYIDATPALRNPIGRRLIQLPFRMVDPTTAYAFPVLLEDPRLAVRPVSRRAVARAILRLLRRSWPLPRRVVEAFRHPAQARREAEVAVTERVARVDQISRRHMSFGERTQMVRVLLLSALPIIPTRFIPLVASGMLSSFVTEALARRWGLDVSKVLAVRQGLAGNPTTEMDLALWNLSQQIKADPEARRSFAEETPESVGAAYRAGTLPESIQAPMTTFFERYGHRGIREIDGGMPRWSDAPEYIIGMIRNYLLLDDPALAPDRHFAELARTAERARRELISAARTQRHGWLKGVAIGFLTSRMRALMGAREAPKFWVVRVHGIVRRVLCGAGEELVRRGDLAHADDVFFLRLDEIEARIPDLRAIVARRRAEYARELERRQLPRILTSEGTIITGRRPGGSSSSLDGVGVSPGVREGQVRVIRDPHGAHLAPGEILVAPSTDPAWTPLFLTAGGLVMEAGGLLSHGSVVAREYGIPAVVGVADATGRLTTGQRVRIDGAAGTVELLLDAPASAGGI